MSETDEVCLDCGHDTPHNRRHPDGSGNLCLEHVPPGNPENPDTWCLCSMADRTIATLTRERDEARAEVERMKDSVEWHRRRFDMLQQEQYRMRDPERTILCDILANCSLMRDPNGERYGIAADALGKRDEGEGK